MKKLTKMLSLMLAIIMVFGVTMPVLAAEVDPPVQTTNVIIHKIVMSKEHFDAFDITKMYDPSKAMTEAELQAFFANSAKEIDGIVFNFYKEGDYTGLVPNAGATPTYSYVSGGEPLTVPDGTYLIVENHAESVYVGPNGEQLTGMKAVPQVITLPLENELGRMETVHLYPKNTEEKPTVTKTHEETDAILQMKKDAMVGQVLPYVITTTIPAQAKYATATWTDQMTEGLTLVPNSITVEGAGLAAGDYTITVHNDRSFTVDLTESGLAKINNQTEPQTITIKYSAVLNDLAVVEVPKANDVFFHYGNKDEHGNTPIPTKPNNGQITVVKSFETGTEPPTEIVVELVDAQTGLPVTTGIDANGNPVTITARQTLTGPNWTYTWSNLDNTREYKVVEITKGYVVTYGLGETAGTITISNKKSDNPPPINPDEPVVTLMGGAVVAFKKSEDEE